MGNSNRGRKGELQGRMFITLETNTVKSGETLWGSVHVSLAEEIASPSLYLIFKGNESTLYYTEHYTNGYSYTTTHTGKKLICFLKIKLYQWTDPALPGNFSFPFELKINDNLYPTFKSLDKKGGYAQINYSLRTRLNASEKRPLKFKLPINVYASTITLPLHMYPKNLEKECLGYGTTFFCFKKEYAAARVWIEKAVFSSSDVIDVHIEANLSKFSADIESIEIKVEKIATITANRSNSGSRTEKNRVFWIYKDHTIKKGTEKQILNYRIPVQSILNNDLCYSMSSDLIKCHYVLNLKLLTEIYCCKCHEFVEANQSIVILPVKMQLPMLPPPIAPDQWQAQILHQSYFNADSQNSDNPNTQIIESETVLNKESEKLIA